jgi:pyruvate dehydrogenase complex dehydrogenase (E1) component
VDFSTGSVGLGAVITTFPAYIQDWLLLKGLTTRQISPDKGRTIAVVGDAELDEGKCNCRELVNDFLSCLLCAGFGRINK